MPSRRIGRQDGRGRWVRCRSRIARRDERARQRVTGPARQRRRAGQPIGIAPPLAFMGSDAASFINGVNLLVDSGFTAAMTTGQVDFSGLA